MHHLPHDWFKLASSSSRLLLHDMHDEHPWWLSTCAKMLFRGKRTVLPKPATAPHLMASRGCCWCVEARRASISLQQQLTSRSGCTRPCTRYATPPSDTITCSRETIGVSQLAHNDCQLSICSWHTHGKQARGPHIYPTTPTQQ